MKKIPTVKFLSVLILLILATFLSCSEEPKNDVVTPGNPDSEFEYSDPNVYEVESSPNSTVYDEETGITLSFPEGGTGNVTISKILSTPSTPTELGEGVKIEYTGQTQIAIEIDTAGGYDATVFSYGYFGGYYDTETPYIWESIPIEEKNGSKITFMLVMPTELQKTMAGRKIGSNDFWIARLKPGASLVKQKVATELQILTYYKQFIAEVPSSINAAVVKKKKEKNIRVVYIKKGPYYSGFWSRPFGIGITYTPTVHLTLPPKSQQIAHEIGHYFIHLLVGDKVQSTLEGQANIFDGHGIGDLNGRNIILEDLAYFMEFFLVNTGAGAYDLTEPWAMLETKDPLKNDLPSYEGFTAHFLGQLVRSEPTIRNYRDRSKKIKTPVLNLTYEEVFEIISKKATDINALRVNVENYIGAYQANKLPAIGQRMGWSYSVNGKLVDLEGKPIANANIKSVSIVGNAIDGYETYRTKWSKTKSKKDGSFSIISDVFPGKSTLRVTLENNDSTDIPIEIDWNKPTNEAIELGELKADFSEKIIITQFNQNYITKKKNPGPGLSGQEITSNLNVNGEVLMSNLNTFKFDTSFLNSELDAIISINIDVYSDEPIELNFKLLPAFTPTSWTWLYTGSAYTKFTYSYETSPSYEVYDQSASSPILVIDNETGIGRLSFNPKIHFQNDNYRKWKISPWFNYKQDTYAMEKNPDGSETGKEIIVLSSNGKELFATISLRIRKKY